MGDESISADSWFQVVISWGINNVEFSGAEGDSERGYILEVLGILGILSDDYFLFNINFLCINCVDYV